MSHPPHPSQAGSRLKDVLLAGGAVVVAGLALVIVQQRGEIRALQTAAEMSRTDGRGGVRTARAGTTVMRLPIGPTTAPSGSGRAGDRGEPADTPRVAGGHTRATGGIARLLENPDFVRALALHRQALLDTRFAGLFRRLELGADELAVFKRLLAEKENVALDVVAVSEALPDGPLKPEAMRASIASARAEVEAAIRASLGSERYALYRDYEQTLPQRTVVAQLEQRLSYSSAPLTSAQSEALVQIMVARAPVTMAPDRPAPAALVVAAREAVGALPVEAAAGVAVVNNEVVAEAQAVLTPPQLAALRGLQVEQQATSLAAQLIRDNLPPAEQSIPAMMQFLLR